VFVRPAAIAVLAIHALLPGQSLDEAARRLSARIGNHAAAVENRSSLPSPAVAQLRELLKGDANSPVTVIISENAGGYLLIAELGNETAIIPFKYESEPRRKVAFKAAPIMISQDPILDALVGEGTALVLHPSRITAYSRDAAGRWMAERNAELNLTRPMPRDPRGRIEGRMKDFKIIVPGSTCTGASEGASFGVTCIESADNGWVPGRNVRRDESGPPPGWGSDFVQMAMPCGRFTIATHATAEGEWTDQITAFEDATAQPVSDPLPVPGLITALWAADAPGSLTMVAHTRTGQYELSRITAACLD
jgi:hypothetical protein